MTHEDIEQVIKDQSEIWAVIEENPKKEKEKKIEKEKEKEQEKEPVKD